MSNEIAYPPVSKVYEKKPAKVVRKKKYKTVVNTLLTEALGHRWC